MPAAPMTLEYELSREDLRAAYERDRERLRMNRRWTSWFASGLCIYVIYSGWDSQSWWFKGLLFLIAIHFWTFPNWLYWAGWLLMKSGMVLSQPLTMIIETNDRGFTLRRPKYKSESKYWWSRLTGVDETEFGLELRFDGRDWGEVFVPWKAFESNQMRQEFIDLFHQQLHDGGSTCPSSG